ncbi:hypothetical protein FNV43_RR25425 [Rhamnella rubrinervis]|uniref:Uncharacterized protein n=1 Tax=Rhamnella rubrinervis TaxID=2594499 RepID=A0A8K0GM66_9ROSA|nr:hypothetical protein FNV43_RR25425 [Rhamnella rubrinervis]
MESEILDEYLKKKKYDRIVTGSEGFVGFGEPFSMPGAIRPYYINEEVEKAANFAIEEYNTWGADLVLEQIVKVNVELLGGRMYYITLEATCSYGGEPAFYEAKVYDSSIKFLESSFELFIFRRAIFYNLQEDIKSNHGGHTLEDYTNSKRSAQSEGLMSYRQFIEELGDDVRPVEAGQRYKEYKSEYISTQKRAFFNAHKDEEWLKDKYHPTNLSAVVQRRNEHARQVAKDFLLDLRTGALDLTYCVTPSSDSKSGHELNSDDEPDTKGKAEAADFSNVLKAHPISSQPRRIQADIEQAHALVHKLDFEKGIEDNVLSSNDYVMMDSNKSCGGSVGGLTSVKGLEGTELLDTLITYLWRIHGLNYYGMIERNEPKGFRHVRSDGNNYAESEKVEESGDEWEKKLDSFWQKRLRGQDPLEAMFSKDKIAAIVLSGFKMRDDEYEWKYGNGGGANGYTKRFHAVGYLRRYLKDKPPKYVMDLTKRVHEHLYFQNYMSDPDSPTGTLVVQPASGALKV